MNRLKKIVLLIFLAAMLVLIRMYEDQLFYNVLLDFFKTNHSTAPLPDFDLWKLIGNVSLRYFLNTLISLAILWVVFQERSVVKISVVLYGILFVVLMSVFLVLVHASEIGQHLTLFYVRRFLIQPLFLLILLPAFYFQQNK
ncbi:MAG: exosortase F system-associated protein [Altibacter sp.]|uniref:exosortase F system-associated membrane protein n=1 Tax=Altibacter sp. TaxID=2024823 RepID=UPI001D7F9880|nr:exosortase F system-associated protein [Altibacter sp.]MBZ0327418.1 exosortase F system-associated protein [Altibacter sp.]